MRSSTGRSHSPHDILRRRDKPYTIQHARVTDIKKPLKLFVTDKGPSVNYTFLPLGTKDLAEACKEISRKAGYAVYEVNKDPQHQGSDTERLAHYIHRIGYHFRKQVVLKACSELGYVKYSGRYMKQADVDQTKETRRRAYEQLDWPPRSEQNSTTSKEDDITRATAMCKELFPHMPEEDLDAILQHAWEKDSKRVGTAVHLTVARRVQLAVGARIRHKYTDYDTLLRAFGDWPYARILVEPVTLKKLKEWRGDDRSADNEVEELIREIIVIDDDDSDNALDNDVARQALPAETGYNTETSLDTQRGPLTPGNFRVNHDPENHQSFQPHDPMTGVVHQRYMAMLPQIDEARREMRHNPESFHDGQATRADVPVRGPSSTAYVVDGQVFRKIESPQPVHSREVAPLSPARGQYIIDLTNDSPLQGRPAMYNSSSQQPTQTNRPALVPYPPKLETRPKFINSTNGTALQDWPVASIEPSEHPTTGHDRGYRSNYVEVDHRLPPHTQYGPAHAQIAPVQYVPRSYQRGHEQPFAYERAAPTRYLPPVPQPSHGAPAPVQQMPRVEMIQRPIWQWDFSR